ncbi:MAG: glutamate formimidoyltransferase [Ezakiella sp.]|nr:glutamate formimidoyltransferase [Ezakiella sp.]MDD7761169.1 glutamate formimidoyltransferase [Bacillota bacterium]MDY3947328.1 glutamate formimidoyltransferase [Ezakiella sp.]
MARILQCVPNFSEGRDKEKVEKIVEEVRKVEGVKLLDYSSDPTHNRSVVTFVGDPDKVIEAAFNACKAASELIDMTKHEGEHPRMGAMDVCPLIPISEITMDEAVEYSKKLAQRVGDELGISVYLYERSATKSERENLADVRRGQYEAMEEKLKSDGWAPDYGPIELNKKSGVSAIGARPALVAYNVNLNTSDVEIAKKIAKSMRAKGGGFTYCKAIGLLLEDKNLAQVSMNLVDYTKTPIFRVFEAIKREAERYGVSIVNSEVIGLVPMQALVDCAQWYLQVDDFDINQVLETRLHD